MPEIIGLDLDNTIACYDGAIATLAAQQFKLPAEVPLTKIGIRDHLRATGREPAWTEFQGLLYGPGMAHATPFDGALTAISNLIDAGHTVVIVSHRSRHPYLGPKFDLHASARAWIERILRTPDGRPLGLRGIHLNEQKVEKIAKVRELGCTVFVDDLLEVLTDPAFPDHARRIWFAPEGAAQTLPAGTTHARDWATVLLQCRL
ncbi:MAG: hypothetical protein FJX59_19415 [Alphaproteobacteria bacterium]|nr:hypothetical protein [Alphaproteobacteria bacterium]